MNLLFLMSFIEDLYNFFKGPLEWIYSSTFPYDNLKPENVSTYVSSTNRIIIFILGLTVSANIYLYTTRIKISSSIMWASRQIGLLTTNIIVNLLILLVGTIISNYDFVFDYQATDKQIKNTLLFYLLLNVISVFLFLLTLTKFISGFRTDNNMKVFDLKINRRIYPINIFTLFKERKQIMANSKEALDLLNRRNKIQSSGYSKMIKPLNANDSIIAVKKILLALFRGLIFIDEFFQIISHRKNARVVRTVSMTQKELEKLILDIEIHCQNLTYTIEKKSDKSMEEHLNRWNATFSKLVMLLFHIDQKNDVQTSLTDVYERLLHQHSKLILATAGSYDHRSYHKTLIISMFTGLVYKDEIYTNISKEEFGKRTSKLEESYFKELLSLFISLMKNDNFEIFELLQSDELGIDSFINSAKENEKFFRDKSRQDRFENLFLSVLISMTELEITRNFSTVMAILLTLVEVEKKQPQSISAPVLSNSKKEIVPAINPQRNIFINLSHENKVGLYYAAVKANEIENYKAAGYIIKILTSNLTYSSLSKVMIEITNKNLLEKNRSYHTGVHKVEFNDYSFKYCIEKTFVLINAQYYLIGDFEYTEEILSIFANIDISYFVKKIGTKQKDYNMLALNEDYLASFENLVFTSVTGKILID